VLLFKNTVSIVWARPFCDPVVAGVSAGTEKVSQKSGAYRKRATIVYRNDDE